jgi:exodeoxyribonuclease V
VWSAQQERALRKARRWIASGDQRVFRIFGYAGTGKTHLAAEIGSWVRRSHFAALTGKAVQVLRARGCDPASTLHRLVYDWTLDDDGIPRGRLRKPREFDLDLLIIDECSMIDHRLARDVLRLDIPLLVLGDPFQLPPVGDGEGFFMRKQPDTKLTEIHRQAAGNAIISFAHQVRQGHWRRRLRPRDSIAEEVRIVQVHGFPTDFDTVLCGTNESRHELNAEIRRDLGYSGPIPQMGETLVCLRNDMTVSDPVFNGSTWHVLRSQQVSSRTVELELRAQHDPESYTVVQVPVACFGRDPPPFDYRRGLQQFAFGYALTVHKAQGSEWANVMLVDERFYFPSLRQRWLYTGLTRARERITILVQR